MRRRRPDRGQLRRRRSRPPGPEAQHGNLPSNPPRSIEKTPRRPSGSWSRINVRRHPPGCTAPEPSLAREQPPALSGLQASGHHDRGGWLPVGDNKPPRIPPQPRRGAGDRGLPRVARRRWRVPGMSSPAPGDTSKSWRSSTRHSAGFFERGTGAIRSSAARNASRFISSPRDGIGRSSTRRSEHRSSIMAARLSFELQATAVIQAAVVNAPQAAEHSGFLGVESVPAMDSSSGCIAMAA